MVFFREDLPGFLWRKPSWSSKEKTRLVFYEKILLVFYEKTILILFKKTLLVAYGEVIADFLCKIPS